MIRFKHVRNGIRNFDTHAMALSRFSFFYALNPLSNHSSCYNVINLFFKVYFDVIDTAHALKWFVFFGGIHMYVSLLEIEFVKLFEWNIFNRRHEIVSHIDILKSLVRLMIFNCSVVNVSNIKVTHWNFFSLIRNQFSYGLLIYSHVWYLIVEGKKTGLYSERDLFI